MNLQRLEAGVVAHPRKKLFQPAEQPLLAAFL
jgi:hypothetical protein